MWFSEKNKMNEPQHFLKQFFNWLEDNQYLKNEVGM